MKLLVGLVAFPVITSVVVQSVWNQNNYNTFPEFKKSNSQNGLDNVKETSNEPNYLQHQLDNTKVLQ